MKQKAIDISVGISLETQAELKRLKGYFPFRIVFCAYLDGSWNTYVCKDKRLLNSLLKKGAVVWTT